MPKGSFSNPILCIILFCFLSSSLFLINVRIATAASGTLSLTINPGDITNFPSKYNVQTDKIWTIKFNCLLDPSIDVENYISVTDSKGNHISVSADIGNDGQSIIVGPPQGGYVPSEKYSVVIDNELRSKTGKSLTKSVQMEFTVASSAHTSPFTFKSALDAQMTKEPQIYKSKWVNASRTETGQYLNPNNYYSGAYKYQFLDLSCSNDVGVDILKSYLAGRGILSEKENVFKEAANTYGVSEVYLVAHSCHETGNGTSQLATGVVHNGVKVYNMYGINAVDSDPVKQGAKKAYEMGWTTPELAIRGGAEWISRLYINHSSYQQNTLYKMRWNPVSPGTHQYATDIKWAVSQSNAIKKMFEQFPGAVLKFDVTSYSDLRGPSINLSKKSLDPSELNTLEDIKPFKWTDINAGI